MEITFILSIDLNAAGPSVHLMIDIIKEISKENIILNIIMPYESNSVCKIPDTLINENNINFYFISIKQVKKSNFINRFLKEIKYSFSCRKIYKKLNYQKSFFIQSCNTAFIQIFLIKRTFRESQIVYNVQDIFPDNAAIVSIVDKNSFIFKCIDFMQKYAYNNSNIITISEDMKKTLMNKGVEKNKIFVAYNWSANENDPLPERYENDFAKKYNITSDNYNVIYAGNIGKMQNVGMIMEVANKLKNKRNIKFYIVGEGIEKNALIEKKENYGLHNVYFIPKQPSSEALKIYRSADINIVPLAKGVIKTALPSKFANCFLCERPILACFDTDSIFANYLLKHNYIIVDCDDIDAIEKEICKLFMNQKSKEPISSSLFKKDKNLNIYTSIILGRGSYSDKNTYNQYSK